MCAALTTAGTADLVWTVDVVDTLLFGATAVLTHANNMDQGRAVMLSYKAPHRSCLHVIRREGVPQYLQNEVCPPETHQCTFVSAFVTPVSCTPASTVLRSSC